MCTSEKKNPNNSKGTLVVIVVFVVSCLWMAMKETAPFPILLFTISKAVSQVTIHQIQLYFYSIIRMLIKSRFHTRKNKTLFQINWHKCFKSSPSCDWRRIITMESTMKLQVMISTVSNMLLKGSHGATSRASCREQDRDGETASALQLRLLPVSFLSASCSLLLCVWGEQRGLLWGLLWIPTFCFSSNQKPLGAKLLRVVEVVLTLCVPSSRLPRNKLCTVEPSALALSVSSPLWDFKEERMSERKQQTLTAFLTHSTYCWK